MYDAILQTIINQITPLFFLSLFSHFYYYSTFFLSLSLSLSLSSLLLHTSLVIGHLNSFVSCPNLAVVLQCSSIILWKKKTMIVLFKTNKKMIDQACQKDHLLISDYLHHQQ